MRKTVLTNYVREGVQRSLARKAPRATITVSPAFPGVDDKVFGVDNGKRTFGYLSSKEGMEQLDEVLGKGWDVCEGVHIRYVTSVEIKMSKGPKLVAVANFAFLHGKLGCDYRSSLRADISAAWYVATWA